MKKYWRILLGMIQRQVLYTLNAATLVETPFLMFERAFYTKIRNFAKIYTNGKWESFWLTKDLSSMVHQDGKVGHAQN